MACSGVRKTVVCFVVVFFLFFDGTSAAVYKVGDSHGWTLKVKVDYAAWAAENTYHVGDILLFVYNSSFHNVMEVSETDFGTCNSGSPLATYTTGNDSITIKTTGHHCFLCGVPGHCQRGQKFDILVVKSGSSAAPSASPVSSAPGGSRSSGSSAALITLSSLALASFIIIFA